jgi:DNA-binding transcriptional regulator YdaS (Cro superfamily)
MTLREWLDREGRGAQRRLRRTLGLAHSSLSRIVRGHSVPSLRTALAIERATDGAVTVADLVREERSA